MAPSKSQHSESRWVPKTFELALTLSKKFLKGKSPFLLLISMEEGFTFPKKHSCFAISNTDKETTFIKVSVSGTDSMTDHIAFSTTSPVEEVSVICSKLNMAGALKCKLTVKLDVDKAIFSIVAPNESVEKNLVNQYFSLFENVSC